MSSIIDLEAQQVAPQAPPRAVTHEMDILRPHTSSVPNSLRLASTSQDINDEAQPVVSQTEGSGARDIPGMNVYQFRSRGGVSGTSSNGKTRAEAHIPVASSPSVHSDPRHGTPDPAPEQEPDEPHMIGDFDGNASEFWKLFRDEAKSHDDARIDTLQEGMSSALIFAGLFSAALTAFVVDSKQNLQPSRADETVYYLRQHSSILSQISVQLSSITPQVAIPSAPPPPFPVFNPSASDIRVNVFWFMALAFSLLAALLAILVQKWVRNYMLLFQRYGDPLKSSRLRQYLYEGCERWYMPRVAEVVPGFLHISLCLFFLGLGDSLLNIDRKVALSTIVPIGISGLLYIFTVFAPIIYPQSPYQNLFSGFLWYLTQKLRGRRFGDRGSDVGMKSVSGDMVRRQMQLAMDETEARKDRDERAIRWLIGNLTEDAEMEKFLSAMPGSFTTDWGTEVWKRVGKHHESEDQSHNEPGARPRRDTTAHPSSSWSIHRVLRPIIHLARKPTLLHAPTHATTPSPVPHPPNVHPHSTTAHIRGENAVHDLSTRVARSVEICKQRRRFAADDLWRKRTRACIEAVASLVCCANAKLAWFGEISKLVGDIGRFEKIRELSLAGTDELFVTRWTCLSLVAIRPILQNNVIVENWAREAMDRIAKEDDSGNDDALAAAQKIDETIKKVDNCLFLLCDRLALFKRNRARECEIVEFLRGYESQISELEQINIEVDRLESVDESISKMQDIINLESHKIISQFPGVLDDFDLDYEVTIPLHHLGELSRDPRKLQFIHPRQTLKSMCSLSLSFREILEGRWDAYPYHELWKNPETILSSWQGDEMQRQLWHLQDLGDGGALGFTVELFFLALSQLFSTSSSSKESYSALCTATFQTITSDWIKHKHSLGTQKLLLDIAMSRRREFEEHYPAHIVDEFLLLLGNIFEGQTGPHIDRARQHLESIQSDDLGRYRERTLMVLTRGQAQSLVS